MCIGIGWLNPQSDAAVRVINTKNCASTALHLLIIIIVANSSDTCVLSGVVLFKDTIAMQCISMTYKVPFTLSLPWMHPRTHQHQHQHQEEAANAAYAAEATFFSARVGGLSGFLGGAAGSSSTLASTLRPCYLAWILWNKSNFLKTFPQYQYVREDISPHMQTVEPSLSVMVIFKTIMKFISVRCVGCTFILRSWSATKHGRNAVLQINWPQVAH